MIAAVPCSYPARRRPITSDAKSHVAGTTPYVLNSKPVPIANASASTATSASDERMRPNPARISRR